MQKEAVVAYFEVLPRHLEEMKETTNRAWWSVTLSRFEKCNSDHKTGVTAVGILLGSTSLQKLQNLW
jgi:esterase/lipase